MARAGRNGRDMLCVAVAHVGGGNDPHNSTAAYQCSTVKNGDGDYAITLTADYAGLEYPVRTDLTLRRVQRFKTKPGKRLTVRIGDAAPAALVADARGHITVPGVSIPSAVGIRITIHR